MVAQNPNPFWGSSSNGAPTVAWRNTLKMRAGLEDWPQPHVDGGHVAGQRGSTTPIHDPLLRGWEFRQKKNDWS